MLERILNKSFNKNSPDGKIHALMETVKVHKN
jgi:hypothetical protein